MANGLADSKYVNILVCCVVISAIFFIYNYDVYLFLRPQSVHFWRQTDSLAFISGFYKSGLGLFHPSVLNQQCGNGNSASEFPLFYFIIAKVQFLYNHKEVALKSIYLFIYFFGIINLFRLYGLFNLHIVFKTGFVLLITSSTVLSYYACNVVPDSCAFGLTLSGIYYYFRNKKSRHIIFISLFTICFAYASVLKVQFVIFPLALFFSEISQMKRNEKYISYYILHPIWLILIPAATWYLYVIKYNEANCSTCFLTTIRPLWDLSGTEIRDVWISVTKNWYSSYYYPSALHLLFVTMGICVLFFKFIRSDLKWILCYSFSGCLLFFILFYYQFFYHDYYFISFIPFVSLLPIAFNDVYMSLIERLNKWFAISMKACLIIIALLSINYGRNKLIKRYQIVEKGIETVSKDYYSLDVYLDEINVPQNALVLSYPDHTCNATLYFMDRKGWTLSMPYSEENITEYVKKGAAYLIVKDKSVLSEAEYLKLEPQQIGQHGEILIFKL